mgnify:CR=1 FL=1
MKLKSSEPFWLIKNGLLHSYPSLRHNAVAEVLIIGGGITGSLIAHQCIKEGYETVLVDRREVANGSTSATTSMLQYEIDVPLYELSGKIGEKGALESYRACCRSINDLSEISREVHSGCEFKKKDSLYFAALKKDRDRLKKEYEARRKAGFSVRWLEEDDVRERYGLQNAFGGILSGQAASADAFRLTHDILNYNHQKGLAVYDKTEIREVSYKPGGVTAVTADGHTIRARKIIYCNGFESTGIVREKFVKLISTYAVAGEQNDHLHPELANVLIWNTGNPYTYMRVTDDSRLLIGGEDEDFVNTAKRDALLGKKQLKLEKRVQRMMPELDFRTDFAWAGTFGETKDGLPVIGKHRDFPSAYFVLGFGGNGITFSVTGMQMVSAMLKNKKHPLEEYFKFRV